MSQRCDKHRYSHSSESSCRQCLIDEQADTIATLTQERDALKHGDFCSCGLCMTIATQHAETVALRYVGERADSKIKALQERIAELENACQAVLRNELNMGQIRAALWKPEPPKGSE
jgi:hypothetical protein